MQCNIPLHVTSCHMHNECYMDNTIHTTYRVPWTITSPTYDFHTSFHSCQYIIQAYINIHMQHVILYSSNDTHTIKPGNGHCTYQFITCQYIGTHILTSKHVTLSQVMTLSIKSHIGPRRKPQPITNRAIKSAPNRL